VGAKRLSYLAWLARIVQPKNDAKRSLADQILAGIPQILGERGVEITLTKWSWVVVIEQLGKSVNFDIDTGLAVLDAIARTSYPFGQPRPDAECADGLQRLSDEQLSERKRGARDGEGSLRAAA
jgi:hypothetical protein